MPKNMGTLDRAVRTFIAIIFLGLFKTGIISGLFGAALAILGITLLVTSVVSYCPLYSLFGITTCPANNR